MKNFLFVSLLIFSLSGSENLFKALPSTLNVDKEKAELGRLLFHDGILSKDGTVSCATCHPLLNYGVDGLKKSFGINNQQGKRNTPSVWNARYNFVQHWDGRAKDLKEQVLIPIQNPVEMGETLENIIRKLKESTLYNKGFQSLYKEGVTASSLADAIAEFEKTLITPGSKFDRYLNGEKGVLSVKEREGLQLFKEKGCVACHNGMNIGGALYQKIGLFKDFSAKKKADLGRYDITGNPHDRYYFKVPSLRNIEKTAPYFHNGSVSELEEAVRVMAIFQLGRELTQEEIEKIVSFLKTLTGNVHE